MKLSDKIGIAGVVVALLAFVVSVLPDSDENSDTPSTVEHRTSGDRSPAISGVSGDVAIDYSITIVGKTKQTKPLPVLDVSLPRNNEDVRDTSKLVQFFDDLNELSGQIIYIRFSAYVGAGFGIKDVPAGQPVRAGVVLDLSEFLDGFGGNRENYEYGYRRIRGTLHGYSG